MHLRTMKLAHLLLLTLAIGCTQPIFAQRDIRTAMVFKANTTFDFTDEWQYLSTDLYLFNRDKFGKLINELIYDKKHHKKSDEFLEFLCITAKLKDVRFFDNQDVVYPIYNFQIDKDRNKNYSTRISNNREVVRLIDNLPLASTNDLVEAEIEAKAITNHRRPQIYDLVSTQLVNIAKITNPTSAVMSLVGEFGNFLQSSSQPEKKQHYEFSSTIRLYEGENFNQRLYSVRVYAFLPPEASAKFDGSLLQGHIAASNNPKIDRPALNRLNTFKDYPFIVIVNYRSRYEMPAVVGDEVDGEMIRNRRQEVERDYKLELINDATYLQERKFTEYLKAFAGLKKEIESYTLAYEVGNTGNISQTLFAIVRDAYELRQILRNRDQEFAADPSYQNIFREKYLDIARHADLYLDKDFNLKNCKVLVKSLFDLERIRPEYMDSTSREQALAGLYAVNLPDLQFLQNTVVGQEIMLRTTNLEAAHYAQIFQQDCELLDRVTATDASLPQRKSLLQRGRQTNCRHCQNKIQAHAKAFDARYSRYKISELQRQKIERVRLAQDLMFDFYKQQACIAASIDSLEKNSMPAHYMLLMDRFDETNTELALLADLIKAGDAMDEATLKELQGYLERLDASVEAVQRGYGYICEKEGGWCCGG